MKIYRRMNLVLGAATGGGGDVRLIRVRESDKECGVMLAGTSVLVPSPRSQGVGGRIVALNAMIFVSTAAENIFTKP